MVLPYETSPLHCNVRLGNIAKVQNFQIKFMERRRTMLNVSKKPNEPAPRRKARFFEEYGDLLKRLAAHQPWQVAD